MYPVVGSSPIEVTLYTKEEVQYAIDELKGCDEYTRILHSKEIVENPDELTELSETYHTYWIMPPAPKSSHKKAFGNLKDLPDLSGAGVSDMREMCELIEFLFTKGAHTLKRVKDKGSCLYAAIRRCTTIGKECSNTHLRRYLIMRVCFEHEFFFKVLKVAIAKEYGAQRLSEEEKQEKIEKGELNTDDIADYELPGPFSFCSFLEHIHRRSSWGDKLILLIFSLIWQVRITILMSDTKQEIRIRHDLPLKHDDLDLLLVLGGSNHFSGTGKQKRLLCIPSIISAISIQVCRSNVLFPRSCIPIHQLTRWNKSQVNVSRYLKCSDRIHVLFPDRVSRYIN